MANLVVGSSYTLNGVMLDCEQRLTKANAVYFSGTLLYRDGNENKKVGFKVWGDTSAAVTLVGLDLTKIRQYFFTVMGAAKTYNDIVEIHISNLDIQRSDLTPTEFSAYLPARVSAQDCESVYIALFQNGLSQKGADFLNNEIIKKTDIISRFYTEFAARSHHDNAVHGLLNHSTKVLRTVNFILKVYPNLHKLGIGLNEEDTKDLFLLGAFLHDLGKIWEMNYGTYTDVKSRVTHRILGVEWAVGLKDTIISAYSEEWYYDFLAILSQHHGEYAEPCKSVFSYIIHLADNLDSKLTVLSEIIEDQGKPAKIYIDDLYLDN